MLAHVLRAETDIGTPECFGHFAQRCERRADDNVHCVDVRQCNFQIVHQGQRRGDGVVHLPVSGDGQIAVLMHTQLLNAVMSVSSTRASPRPPSSLSPRERAGVRGPGAPGTKPLTLALSRWERGQKRITKKVV